MTQSTSKTKTKDFPGNSDRILSPPPVPLRRTEIKSHSNTYEPGYNTNIYNNNPLNAYNYPPYTNGGFNSLGGGYFGGGGYNSYPSAPYGYCSNQPYNRPVDEGNGSLGQKAELSARRAFQSVENIVRAVSSIAVLLESTFQAVYTSIRAVNTLAEHFSRINSQLVRFTSALSLIRLLNWFSIRLKLLLNYIKLLRPSQSTADNIDKAWIDGLSTLNNLETNDELNIGAEELTLYRDINFSERKSNHHTINSNDNNVDSNSLNSSWPVLAFFAVVFISPWAIWKLAQYLISNDEISRNSNDELKEDKNSALDKDYNEQRRQERNDWAEGKSDHFVAIADYDFQTNFLDEISLKKNDKIILAPERYQPRVRGWVLGSLDGVKTGLVPQNYIRIVGKKVGKIDSEEKSMPINNNKSLNPELILGESLNRKNVGSDERTITHDQLSNFSDNNGELISVDVSESDDNNVINNDRNSDFISDYISTCEEADSFKPQQNVISANLINQ